MKLTNVSDVFSWHREMHRLFTQQRCDNPDFLRPFHFVMLALGAKIHGPGELTIPVRLRDYAARMDLWKAIGQEDPAGTGRNDLAGRFLPIQPLHDSETVFATADALAEIARPSSADDETVESLSIALVEVMNNCFDHAAVVDGLTGLACAQSWPRGRLAQIAIADAGVGVRTSLGRNPALRPRLTENACDLATELHVTGNPAGGHAGYGLAVARQLIEQNGGTFILASGQEWVCARGGKAHAGEFDLPLRGTLVVLEWRTDHPLNVGRVYEKWPERE